MEFKRLTTTKKNWKNSCKYILLHHTAMGGDKNGYNAAYYLSWPQTQWGMVSVQFVVWRDWTIWAIWEENDRLWHAGDSEINFLGITDWNSHSIWIEIDSNWTDYTQEQIKATNELVIYLIKKYNLPYEAIWRHADITKRKWDVWPNFFINQGCKDLQEYRLKLSKSNMYYKEIFLREIGKTTLIGDLNKAEELLGDSAYYNLIIAERLRKEITQSLKK